MDVLAIYVKEGLPLAWDLPLKTHQILNVFMRLYFIQGLTSFSSVHHLLCLYAWFLMLFHQM